MSTMYSEEAESIAAATQRMAEEAGQRLIKEKMRPTALIQMASSHRTKTVPDDGQAGPIPSPFLMEQYDRLLPGSAERILYLIEKEQGHRHHQEQMNMESSAQDARISLIFAYGFIMCIVSLCLGGGLSLMGRELAGGLIGGGGFICFAMIFGIIALQYKGVWRKPTPLHHAPDSHRLSEDVTDEQ